MSLVAERDVGPFGAVVAEMSAREAYAALAAASDARLVDVRTAAEWTFVGVPDLSGLGREPLFVEWQGFPGGRLNRNFVADLVARLDGAGPATPLYFLCRSGARSRAAAETMLAAGYRTCVNISDGFEGPSDGRGRRGAVSGWKAAGLPWLQS